MSVTLSALPLAFMLPNVEGIYKIAVFLVMLSVLVVLHEYGHFLLARRNGVRVNDFAVGFGPTLLKWTSPRSGTNYRINVLPIGGYCAMQGEDGKTSEAEQQRAFRDEQQERSVSALAGGVAVLERPATAVAVSPGGASPNAGASDNFQAKSATARLAIVVAGPVANFIVTLVLLFFVALAFGVPQERLSTTVGPLENGYPAQRAGLRPGDEIRSVNGAAVTDGDQLVGRIHGSLGKPLTIGYERHGVPATVRVTPRSGMVDGKTVGLIGYSPMRSYHRVGPVAAVSSAFSQFGQMMAATVEGLAALIMHPVKAGSQVQGVIGLARVSATMQDFGWGIYLQLAATISLSLGILNLIPFPALDGGRAAFIVAEMFRGKPVDPEKEALVHLGGFAALMAVMIFVAYHDISNILSGKGVL